MNQLSAPSRFRTPLETERCEYDDGNPGTILTRPTAMASSSAPSQRRAGDWAQHSAATYYDDGEMATILV